MRYVHGILGTGRCYLLLATPCTRRALCAIWYARQEKEVGVTWELVDLAMCITSAV
jgi:hypothetical protein